VAPAVLQQTLSEQRPPALLLHSLLRPHALVPYWCRPAAAAAAAAPPAGIASAPLWDGEQGRVCGMLSASDFIHMLQRLRSVVSSSANPMSEQEMDLHTIRCAPAARCPRAALPAGGASVVVFWLL
jgi:hypothetical protein